MSGNTTGVKTASARNDRKSALPRTGASYKPIKSKLNAKAAPENAATPKSMNVPAKMPQRLIDRLYTTSTISRQKKMPDKLSDEPIITVDSKLHSRFIKEARRTGVLNLSGKHLTAIPDQVYYINDPNHCEPRNKKHGLSDSIPDDTDFMIDLSKPLDEDAWWNMKPLEKLMLSDNEISEMSNKLRNLPNLIVLDLKSNYLSKLPNTIGSCTFLQKLYLSHNQLQSLPESIGQLVDLRLLKCDHNELTHLPESINRLGSLDEADFSFNNIINLPTTCLNGWHVRRLILNNNQLTEIGGSEIGWLQSLVDLDLGNNKLTTLPDEVGQLGRLERLNLANNRLSSLPKLENCACLKELLISNNNLRTLDSDYFKPTPTLKIIDISHNQIELIPISLLQLCNLERLNLDKNALSDLPNELSLMKTLKVVSANGNPITKIRKDILQRGHYEILRHLRERLEACNVESNNNKASLPEKKQNISADQGTDIQVRQENWPQKCDIIRSGKLDISSRDLVQLPVKIFESLNNSEIKHVDLSNNKLVAVDDILVNVVKNLVTLNLSHNALKDCLQWSNIEAFQRLRSLNLSINRITNLPDAVGNLPKLSMLNISENRLKSVPVCIFNLPLTELLLGGNKIEEINVDSFMMLQNLELLDLSRNEIKVLPPQLCLLPLKCLRIEANSFKVPRPATIAKGTDEILRYLKTRLPE